jgi:hypothetical protein
MRRAIATGLTASILAVAVASCSSPASPASPDGQEGTAIQSHPYLRLPGVVATGKIIDFAGLLYNHDGRPFRVRSIRLISPTGPGIGAVKIRGLAPSDANGGTFAYYQGDLAKCGPEFDYKIRPVSRIVEPPRAASDWRVLVSVVFARPGRYHLYLLKVVYDEDGRRYWNYVRADIPVRAVPPGDAPGGGSTPC